jgi:hypothetical protein
VFLSNSKNKSYIEQLSKEVELVREKIYTKLFPPRNQEESISPVRVLDTQAEYEQYGGPGGSAGYFSPDSGELVLFTKFEDVTKTKSALFCRAVMFHEAFHHTCTMQSGTSRRTRGSTRGTATTSRAWSSTGRTSSSTRSRGACSS